MIHIKFSSINSGSRLLLADIVSQSLRVKLLTETQQLISK